MAHQTILVLDFGSQFTQLIARRLRELSVYCEILPFNTSVEALKARLAESKAVVAEREEFESGETPVDQAEPVPTEVGDRRQSVHDRGRQVAEQMRRGTNAPE